MCGRRPSHIPTDAPEADGTFAWDATTLVLVTVGGGGKQGIGHTYADPCLVPLIEKTLAKVVLGVDALDPPAVWRQLNRQVRNLGQEGLAAMAISALDAALWDLKGQLLDRPLAVLLGRARDRVPVYGSGGFTTYDDARLQAQLGGWVAEGCRAVKMKIGSHPEHDPARMLAARAAIGPEAALFIDANGAFGRREALGFATEVAADLVVSWFEEPVSSDDLEGLAWLRDRFPPRLQVAAGEYGWTLGYFRRMLEGGAIDVLQADASRCGGITGFLQVGALCEAFGIDLSGHCAPALHRHAACAVPRLRHLEWFHDHVRIEQMLFDGAPRVQPDGTILPDEGRPGLGLELRRRDAERFAV